MLRDTKLALMILSAVTIAQSTHSARASTVDTVTMNFASGATFAGTVTFTDDFSSYTAVSGVLTGYTQTSSGYIGTGSDQISWVLYPSTNYASGGPNVFGNWLADGSSGDYTSVNHAIQFTYNYSNGSALTFAAAVDGFLGLSLSET